MTNFRDYKTASRFSLIGSLLFEVLYWGVIALLLAPFILFVALPILGYRLQ